MLLASHGPLKALNPTGSFTRTLARAIFKRRLAA